jgi:selenide,water dikinase
MEELSVPNHPDLLVGYGTKDDAGVYKISDSLALIQTLDFFTPIVDDPYYFGQIAAANALSDVYAMGGRPLTCMNIVCFPIKEVEKDALKKILKGGLDKICEAGAILVGGHSVEDKEMKYGLSVTGVVHPDRVITNAGAKVGDALILTKPVGTGIIATATKGNIASREAIENLIRICSTLNAKASEIALRYNVHALTDVTGFGLAGHLLEMVYASNKEIELWAENVPIIPEALEYASMGFVPAGTYANRSFCSCSVEIVDGISPPLLDLMFDAQTSGGLIISLPKQKSRPCLDELHKEGIKDAAIIGQVVADRFRGKIRVKSVKSA